MAFVGVATDDLYAVAVGSAGAPAAHGVVVSQGGTTLVHWPAGRASLVGASRPDAS